jgi:hypothetical protein
MKNFLLLLLILGACAPISGPRGATGPAAPTVTPAPVSDVDADIKNLLSDENTYRVSLGQSALSAGLSCSLSTITGGDRIQASIAGHNTLTGITQVYSFTFMGEFNQADSNVSAGLNVLPEALRPIYTNMFLLRCQGQIVIRETDYVPFELTSDDGSVLYIDGVKVIDNDNAHGAVKVTGVKQLRRGVHTFRLDFAQSGGGNQALILTSGNEKIANKFFAH